MEKFRTAFSPMQGISLRKQWNLSSADSWNRLSLVSASNTATRRSPAPRGRIPDNASVVDRALRKLKTKVGQQIYSKRKETIEPVFGQIKEARGIRAFLLRGLEKVKGEWKLVCLTHNILKLWRHLWLDEGRSAPIFG